jgi:hypothetical protein
MVNTISEADWKIYRKLHPIALERYSEKILEEVSRLISKDRLSSHDRLLALKTLVEETEQEIDLVFDTLRRSTALRQLAYFRFHELLTAEEFESFSGEARSFVERWFNLQRG